MVVTFFVAVLSVLRGFAYSSSDILKDCRIVQLATTHSSRASVYIGSVHRHAWSVIAQGDFEIEEAMHFSFRRSVSLSFSEKSSTG